MNKPTPEQVRARRDLARVTAEIDVQMGGADHRVNLAECHLALRASHADLLSALALAADTFRSYATKHFLKMTPEGDEKAHENLRLAEQMEAAIAKAEAK